MSEYYRTGRPPLRSSTMDPRFGDSVRAAPYQSLERARLMTPYESRNMRPHQPYSSSQPFYGAPAEDVGVRRGPDAASERYTRLLERDIETLREELRIAREKADDPQLMRELRDTQDTLRHEKQLVADLERQLASSETTAAKLTQMHEECDRLRQESRQQQLDLTHIQRDLSHAQDTIASAEARESQLNSDIDRLKEEISTRDQRVSELQHENLQLKRQADRDKETAGLNHSRELSKIQMELSALQQKVTSKDHELKSRDHTIDTLQSQLKKEVDRSRESQAEYEKTVSQLRHARHELEQSLRSAVQESENKSITMANKEEVIRSFAEQKKDMQSHIDAQSEVICSLRDDLSKLQSESHERTEEIEHLQSKIGSLEEQLETAHSLRQAEENRVEQQKKLYVEVAEALQATESQKHSGLVSHRAKEILAARDQAESELRNLQKEFAVVSRENSSKDTTIAQLERAVERGSDDRERMEKSQSSLREELLARTRELKDATVAQESLTRELRLQEERNSRYDDIIAEKDRQIENVNRRIEDIRNDTDQKLDDMRDNARRTEDLHRREAERLKNEVSRLKEMNQSDRQYSDICHRIGLALNIDPNVTANVYADNLYQAIDALKRRADIAEMTAANMTAQSQVSRPTTSHGVTHINEYDRLREEHELRQRVEELEEESNQYRVELEMFRRDVARAVGCKQPYDEDAILEALDQFVKTNARTNKGPTSRRRLQKKNETTNEIHDQEVSKLKRKLTAALKTIESQEIWISAMEKKVKPKGNISGSQHDEQIRSLQAEAAYWKQQFSLAEQSRPATGMLNSSGIGLGTSDLVAFKTTIADLDSRLQKHIDFRAKVIRALQMPVISAPDNEIIRAIEDAVTAKLQNRRQYSSTTPRY